MRKLIVAEHISLDGVIQAPGGPEEDPSGGFRFGGWIVPYADDATGQAVQIPRGLMDPICTLTATIAAELGEAVEGGVHYRMLFVIGLVLFLLTFAVNLIADLVVKGIHGEQNQ